MTVWGLTRSISDMLPESLDQRIHGIGVDIVSIARISGAIKRCGTAFLERVYCDTELEYCNKAEFPEERFAACWAAKEAAVKALGTGFTEGIRYRDVCLQSTEGRSPGLVYDGKFSEFFSLFGINHSWVSISHERKVAIAVILMSY